MKKRKELCRLPIFVNEIIIIERFRNYRVTSPFSGS